MHFEPFSLDDGANVTVSFSETRLPSVNHGHALIVSVRGRTGVGSRNNVDAGYIEAMTRAALCMKRPFALIFDFRGFEYECGDTMCAVLCAGNQQYIDSDFPTAVVVSDLCREGLTSLVRDELLANPDDWLFGTLEEAIEAVDRRRQELLKKNEDNAS